MSAYVSPVAQKLVGLCKIAQPPGIGCVQTPRNRVKLSEKTDVITIKLLYDFVERYQCLILNDRYDYSKV